MFNFNNLHPLLLRVLFLLLVLTMRCSSGSASFPTKVVGLFNCAKCAPALAASLAVNDFQYASRNSALPKLVYETWNESQDIIYPGSHLQSAMIIAQSAKICERLAPSVFDWNSILICYCRPTPKILTNLNSSLRNTFLSQTTPSALVPSLFSFINKIHELSNMGEIMHPSHVVVTLVLDPKHSSNQAEETLLINLPKEKFQYQTWWLEKDNKLPLQLCKYQNEVDIVIAAVDDIAARHLFCEMHRRNWLGESVFVILLGPLEKDWMYLKQGVPDPGLPCEAEEFLAAVQGHYLFEFQGWDKESKMTEKVMKGLTRMLLENGKGLNRDFHNEAPFVYDSVWAVLQALNGSISILMGNQSQSSSLPVDAMWQQQLQKPFIGVTGEFSFTREKFRSGNKATIIINRFQNEDYVTVGRHHNGNLSFSPSLAAIIRLHDGWNETMTDLKFCIKPWEMTTRMWIGILLLIIFVSFCIFFVVMRVRRIWRK